MIDNYRYFIIWQHGMLHKDEILEHIEKQKLKILHVRKLKFGSYRRLFKTVYGAEDVPIWHLRSKLKYLKRLPRECIIIFVSHQNHELDYKLGADGRLIIEDKKIKQIKSNIRKKFNPYKKSAMSHDHVIHGCDTLAQYDDMMSFLGYGNVRRNFSSDRWPALPFHINLGENFILEKVSLERLRVSIYNKEERGTKRLLIRETPHYLFCIGQREEYSQYVYNNLGSGLRDYYSVRKYQTLLDSILKEKDPKLLITGRRSEDTILIVDGAHRAAIAAFLGLEGIYARVIN